MNHWRVVLHAEYCYYSENDSDRISAQQEGRCGRMHFTGSSGMAVDASGRREEYDDGRTPRITATRQEIIVQTNTFLSFPKRRFARSHVNKIIVAANPSNAPPGEMSLISVEDGRCPFDPFYRSVYTEWLTFSRTLLLSFIHYEVLRAKSAVHYVTTARVMTVTRVRFFRNIRVPVSTISIL